MKVNRLMLVPDGYKLRFSTLIVFLLVLCSSCSPQPQISSLPTQSPIVIPSPSPLNLTFTPSAVIMRSVTPSTPTISMKVIPDEFKTNIASYDAYSTDALVIPNQPEGQPVIPFDVSWRDNDSVSASLVWKYVELGMAKGELHVNTPRKYSWTDRSEISKPMPLVVSKKGSSGNLDVFQVTIKSDVLLQSDLSVLMSLTVVGKDGGEATRNILLTPFDYFNAIHEIFPVPGNLREIAYGYSNHKIIYSGPLVKYLERDYARKSPFAVKFMNKENLVDQTLIPWGVLIEQARNGNLVLKKEAPYYFVPCLYYDDGKRFVPVICPQADTSHVLDYKLKP